MHEIASISPTTPNLIKTASITAIASYTYFVIDIKPISKAMKHVNGKHVRLIKIPTMKNTKMSQMTITTQKPIQYVNIHQIMHDIQVQEVVFIALLQYLIYFCIQKTSLYFIYNESKIFYIKRNMK